MNRRATSGLKGRHFRSGLKTRFFKVSLLLILAAGLAISGLYYLQTRRMVMEDAYTKSRLILESVEAVRGYVKSTLRPLMYGMVGRDRFIIEAMSTTFVSLKVMADFHDRMPGYIYRRVSLNPHNPDNTADAAEEEMAEWFEADRSRRLWQGMVDKGGEKYFVSMLPDYMDQSCIRCHGDPDNAPPALLERYGRDGGFRFKAGDLAGINSVLIPVGAPLSRALSGSALVFGGAVLICLALLAVINFTFGRMVTGRLAEIISALSRTGGNRGGPEAGAEAGATRPVEPDPTREPGGGEGESSSDELDLLRQSFRNLESYVSLARGGAHRPPDFIGPYLVGAPLAAGRLTWLHHGREMERGTAVGLKIPFGSTLADNIQALCLHTEIRILESMDHPGLLPVRSLQGDVVVTDPLTGRTLDRILFSPERPAWPEVMDLLARVTDATAHLHNLGVVLHEMTPAHFLVSPPDKSAGHPSDGVILFDLGLASWRDLPDPVIEAGLGPRGDRRFQAPEVKTGQRGDPRSDIYSLGVWLHRLTTGAFPESGRKSLNPPADCPAELWTVIETALRPDPDMRFQWVEDLWADLRQAVKETG